MRKTFSDRLFAVQEYLATLFVSPLRRRVFVGFAVVAVLLGVFLFSTKGLVRRMQLAGEKRALERQVEALRHEEDSLRAVRDRLLTDSLAMERVAREQYGLARPGETIYRREPARTAK